MRRCPKGCCRLSIPEIRQSKCSYIPVTERLCSQKLYRIITVILLISSVQINLSFRSTSSSAVLNSNYISFCNILIIVTVQRIIAKTIFIIWRPHQNHRICSLLIRQIQICCQQNSISHRTLEIFYCSHSSVSLLSFLCLLRRLRNATSRINTAFFVTEKQITPHRIWYNRVDKN